MLEKEEKMRKQSSISKLSKNSVLTKLKPKMKKKLRINPKSEDSSSSLDSSLVQNINYSKTHRVSPTPKNMRSTNDWTTHISSNPDPRDRNGLYSLDHEIQQIPSDQNIINKQINNLLTLQNIKLRFKSTANPGLHKHFSHSAKKFYYRFKEVEASQKYFKNMINTNERLKSETPRLNNSIVTLDSRIKGLTEFLGK